MDIYFCDECAARVTAADLRRGFGLKKDDVIVCGTCVEQGRGSERLVVAAAPALTAVAADGERAPGGTAVSKASGGDPLGDAASTTTGSEPHAETPAATGEDPPRDDAPLATADADAPPATADADADPHHDDASAPPSVGHEVHEDETDPLNRAMPSVPTAQSETSEARDDDGLGAMASGLSALSAHDRPGTDEVDDLPDSAATDDTVPGSADAPPASGSDEFPPTDLAPDADGPGGKDETREIEVGPGMQRPSSGAPEPAGTDQRNAVATSSRRKTATSSRRKSSSTRRGGRPISTRRTKTQQRPNPALIYGVSGLTIALLVVAIVVVAMREPPPSYEGPTTVDHTRDLSATVGEAKRQVIATLRDEDATVRELEAAKQAIFDVTTAIEEWEREAKRQGNLTKEQINQKLYRLKTQDLFMQVRSLNDRIQRIKGRDL